MKTNDSIELELLNDSDEELIGSLNDHTISNLDKTENATNSDHKLPEIEFLELLVTISDLEQQQLITKRIQSIKQTDFAMKLKNASATTIAIHRIPAILITLGLELIVGILISRYHSLIQKHILISSFLPILSSLSGNVGLQSSVATTRSIATGHLPSTEYLKCVLNELMCSFLIGSLASVLVFIISFSWHGSFGFAISTTLG